MYSIPHLLTVYFCSLQFSATELQFGIFQLTEHGNHFMCKFQGVIDNLIIQVVANSLRFSW